MVVLLGCTPTPKIPTPTPTVNVAELQEQHRYLSALKTLNASARNAPDYIEQRDALLAAARDYQTALIRELSELLQQQQFVQAQQQLEAAQNELPISRELDQFSEQLYAARDRYQRRYLDEILQLRSGTLLKERQLYQALQKAATDSELQQLVAHQHDDAEYFASQLSEAGTRAFAQSDYSKAVQYLGLANQLTPSTALAQQLKRAEQALTASKQKQQNARSVEREQRYRELSTAFLQDLQQRDYAAARSQLDQLKILNIHNDELEAAQSELDSAIHNFVKQQTDAGNRLYSEGHIEDALQRWRQAVALSPSAELTERIDKAQRFIDRLEQLRRQQ
jgi:tetratricopeptide (TPR) repeat protein